MKFHLSDVPLEVSQLISIHLYPGPTLLIDDLSVGLQR
jgi:hypothetical protein